MTTGIVVAGGRSERFGPGDKALATVDGTPMIRHVVRSLAPVCDGIVVNCRREQRSAFEATLEDVAIPLEFAIDPVPDAGPVVGLETALARVDDERACVTACDIPLVPSAALSALLDTLASESGTDAAVARVDGRTQPLCGAYAVDALAAVIDAVGSTENCSLFALLDRLEVTTVPATRLPGEERTFRNVNTRADLERLEEFV